MGVLGDTVLGRVEYETRKGKKRRLEQELLRKQNYGGYNLGGTSAVGIPSGSSKDFTNLE